MSFPQDVPVFDRFFNRESHTWAIFITAVMAKKKRISRFFSSGKGPRYPGIRPINTMYCVAYLISYVL